MNNKTWSGRFNEPVSELVKQYTGSIDFDQRLAKWDIQGSLAHAQMLHEAGLLSAEDVAAIKQGMAEIEADRCDIAALHRFGGDIALHEDRLVVEAV